MDLIQQPHLEEDQKNRVATYIYKTVSVETTKKRTRKLRKMLKVTNIQRKSDKNGVDYAVVTFNQVKEFAGKAVLSNKSTSRNVRDQSSLPSGAVVKADPLFTAIKAGELTIGSYVDGEIKTVPTTEYKLDGRSITTYSGVVFEGENYLTLFNKNLERNGAVVVGEDGELTAEIPVKQHQEVN